MCRQGIARMTAKQDDEDVAEILVLPGAHVIALYPGVERVRLGTHWTGARLEPLLDHLRVQAAALVAEGLSVTFVTL